MAGKCTIEGVLNGLVGIDELMKLNALLDMQSAYEAYAIEKSRK